MELFSPQKKIAPVNYFILVSFENAGTDNCITCLSAINLRTTAPFYEEQISEAQILKNVVNIN